jgi:hypothetical protein
MKLRTFNALLGVALLAAVGLELALQPAAEEGSGAPLFPGLSLEALHGLRLSGGGVELEIVRGPKGFVLPSLEDFPVLPSAIAGPIEALARLTDLDRVGSGADLEPFGLGAGRALRLACTDAAGAPLAELELGQPAGRGPARGGAGVYVRRAGDPAVYGAPGLAPLAVEPRAFWDGRLLSVPAAELERLELQGSALGAPVELVIQRNASGQFQSADGALLPRPSVEALLVALEALYLSELKLAGASEAGFESGLSLAFGRAGEPRIVLEIEALPPAAGASPKDPVRVRRSDWSPRWIGSLPRQALIDWLGPGGALERLLGALEGAR